MGFFSSFLELLATRYPETARSIKLEDRLSPLLFCPHTVKLPSTLRDEALAFAAAAFRLRELPERKQTLETLSPGMPDPGNYSALMSYDFHVDAEGRLKLIEINTNAAMSLMTDLLYRVHGLPSAFADDFPREIMNTFREEFQRAFPTGRKLENVAIIDENPPEQRLYVEFLAYRELFAREGLSAEVVDSKELRLEGGELRLGNRRIDLVYNRDTDFYFEGDGRGELRAALLAKAACFSPHPHEYRLLADKERLMELSMPGTIESLPLAESDKAVLRSAIIPAFPVRSISDPDELWARRKKLFFKPMRSYGGKAVYRGASVSRPVFANILAGDYLAQEFVPPATIVSPGGDGAPTEFKYDLRFYVYRDRVQLACARLYQGQMTNSSTTGGGIAAIEWI